TGCVNTQVEEQKTQISNLESELVVAQTTNQQAQTELTELNKELTTSTETVDKLTKELDAKNKVVVPVAVPNKNKFDNKSILGQTEWIYVSAAKSNFKARIDSGATTSSINASDIERFERDGKKWVRFNLAHSDSEQKDMIEARIVRVAKITQSSTPDEEVERLVIKLHVRIGDVAQSTEFTLADRVRMEYPVLIGRSFMQDIVLVDVSQEYIYPKYKEKNKAKK
ncbi:MAG: ATP-dependent zinc protease, partial [Psychromonas sp.]